MGFGVFLHLCPSVSWGTAGLDPFVQFSGTPPDASAETDREGHTPRGVEAIEGAAADAEEVCCFPRFQKELIRRRWRLALELFNGCRRRASMSRIVHGGVSAVVNPHYFGVSVAKAEESSFIAAFSAV